MADHIDRLIDRRGLLGLLVVDGDPKLVFDLQDDFEGVEGVRVEVFDELGVAVNAVDVDAELIGEDLDELGFDFGFGREMG